MSFLVEFAIFPTDNTESKSRFVAEVLDIVDRSGLDYQLTPMGTIIESESLDKIFSIIEKAYEILGEKSNRIYSTIKIDYRKGKIGRLNKKIASVENRLGRKLKS